MEQQALDNTVERMKKRRRADEAEEAFTRTQRVDSLQIVSSGYDKSPSRKKNAPAEHVLHQTNHLHHQSKTSSSSNKGILRTSSQCDDGCSILEDVQATIDGADSQHDDKREERAVVKEAGHGDQKAKGVSDQRGRHQDLLASTSSIRRSLGSGGSPSNLHISSIDRDADNIGLIVRRTNTPGQLPLHKEEEILEEIYHLLCVEEEFSSQDFGLYEFIRMDLGLEQCLTVTTLKNYVITKLAPRLYKFPFPLKMITDISTALNIKYSKELELGIERRFNVGVHLKDDRTFHGLSFWPECAPAPTHQHQSAPRSGGSRREESGREREESMKIEVARGARRNDSQISNLFTSPSIPRRRRRSQTSNESESPERPPTSTQRTRFDPTQQRLAVRFVYRQYKEFGRGLRVNNNEFWRKFINHELRPSANKSPQAWKTHFHQVLKHWIYKMPFAPFRRRELLSFLGMDTKVVPDNEPDVDDSFSESKERFQEEQRRQMCDKNEQTSGNGTRSGHRSDTGDGTREEPLSNPIGQQHHASTSSTRQSLGSEAASSTLNGQTPDMDGNSSTSLQRETRRRCRVSTHKTAMSLAHIDIKSGTTTRRLSENALVVKCDSGSSAITISTESDPDIEMCSLSLKNIHEICTFGERCLQWNRRASNQVVTLTFLQASGSEAMANAILANCVWIRLMDGFHVSNTDHIGEVVRNRTPPTQLSLCEEEELFEQLHRLICLQRVYSAGDIRVFELIRMQLFLEDEWTASTLSEYTRDRITPVIYKYGLTLEQIESLLKALAWKCSKELEDGLERRFTVGVHLNPDKSLRGISPWPEKNPNQSEIVEDSMAVEGPRDQRPTRMSMTHTGTTDRSRSRISRRSSPSPLSSPSPPRRAALQIRTRRKPTPFDPSHQYKALKYIYRAYKDYGPAGVSLGSDVFWQRFLDYEGITTKTTKDWRIHFRQSLRHKISHFQIAPYRRRDLLCFIGRDPSVVPADATDCTDSFSDDEEFQMNLRLAQVNDTTS